MQHGCYTLGQFLADLGQIVSEAADEQTILTRVAPLARRVAMARAWCGAGSRDRRKSKGRDSVLRFSWHSSDG